MKQFLVILCLLIGASWTTISAQKVQSTSRSLTIIREPKAPKVIQPHNWFAKVGVGVLLAQGNDEYLLNSTIHNDKINASGIKPNLAFGYQKQFTSQGLYWGAQVGFTFFPGSNKDEYGTIRYRSKVGTYLGPTLGILKPISDSLLFDGHLGASFAYSFENGGFGPLWEVGAGVWINRFLVELMYQGSYMDISFTDYTSGTGIILNFGIKF